MENGMGSDEWCHTLRCPGCRHCSTAWLQAAVPGHPLQCDGLQRDDPRVRHRAAVERIHLAGAGGQQYYDMLTHPSPGRRHLRRVLDVPGDGAALPSALLRPPLPPDHARHQQEHCRQVAGREECVNKSNVCPLFVP